ncbi:DUF4129 domain-containing protein [Saliphagus sp. LR7]|uniref:DUF4129 domain-containing protein n=1 Tax=Saliphagus sp. LR7 TaxID=2282654 RepID=UPI000DF736E9|nr:DUF4129 domain-containing protein [Saliphagus sp. LR7]
MGRDNATGAVIALVSLVVLAVVASSLPAYVPADGPDVTADGSDVHPEDDDSRQPVGATGLVPWELLLPIAFLFAGLLALATVYRMLRRPADQDVSVEGSPDPLDGSEESDDPDDEEPLETVAEAAGAAADRLEGDAVENDVHRAWREMTRALSVSNRRARTTGEFARAAVRAGIDERDVEILTELFEDVRYGGREPTEDDERRAIKALRRIEGADERDRS